jgi:hypothetical protein
VDSRLGELSTGRCHLLSVASSAHDFCMVTKGPVLTNDVPWKAVLNVIDFALVYLFGVLAVSHIYELLKG